MKLYRESSSTHIRSPNFPQRRPLATAAALSLAAAVALGLSRFSYGLLLPPMRADLGWSYLLAGAMNTGNALGYLIGALATPALIRFLGVSRLLLVSTALAGVFMLMSGMVTDTTALFVQRVCAGVASASIFITGGILAARLGSMHGRRGGFLIGLYYGGTGFGIALSALLVPATLAFANHYSVLHVWQWSWITLGIVCLLVIAVLAVPSRAIGEVTAIQGHKRRFAVKDFICSLSGYFMFGAGYIGYMTFVVALLNENGLPPALITLFYTSLGLAVIASSRVWVRMFERYKGGESLAILNVLLGAVTILPALTSALSVIFLSGIVFGGVFLSVVASTTVLVRHNLPQESWPAGITAFTVVFALGQIIGPTMVGWIADGSGGLERGLVASAAALFIGAALASRQRALVTPE